MPAQFCLLWSSCPGSQILPRWFVDLRCWPSPWDPDQEDHDLVSSGRRGNSKSASQRIHFPVISLILAVVLLKLIQTNCFSMACSIWGFYLFSFFNLLPISQVSPLQHTKRSPRRVPLLEEELRGQRAVGALTGQQGDRKKKPHSGTFGWREWESDTGFANGIIIERDIHLCPRQLPIQTNRAKPTLTA